jgi:hypothetical protein
MDKIGILGGKGKESGLERIFLRRNIMCALKCNVIYKFTPSIFSRSLKFGCNAYGNNIEIHMGFAIRMR